MEIYGDVLTLEEVFHVEGCVVVVRKDGDHGVDFHKDPSSLEEQVLAVAHPAYSSPAPYAADPWGKGLVGGPIWDAASLHVEESHEDEDFVIAGELSEDEEGSPLVVEVFVALAVLVGRVELRTVGACMDEVAHKEDSPVVPEDHMTLPLV